VYTGIPELFSEYFDSQVRATNQQDLIYKRGQAGITRASVTAVFNNSDRKKSPAGLEQCAQITVTRQVRPSPSCGDSAEADNELTVK